MSGIRKLFISYRHSDEDYDWVWRTLVPILRAAGCGSLELLIDEEQFGIGQRVVGQMDDLQDQADASLLVLTPDYLASEACRHEMDRAVKGSPDFSANPPKVLPVLRKDGGEPDWLSGLEAPLWCDLRNDLKDGSWEKLLTALNLADGLGIAPAKWLETARDVVQVFGGEHKSVNLVTTTEGANWRSLFDQVFRLQISDFGEIDLNHPSTGTRPDLFKVIIEKTGGAVGKLPEAPGDLRMFGDHLDQIHNRKLSIRHFDRVQDRQKSYEHEVFSALRFATEERRLCLLAQSNVPARQLMPRESRISEIDFHVVEL